VLLPFSTFIVAGYLKVWVTMAPLSIMGWITQITKGFCSYVMGFAVAYVLIYGGLKLQMEWALATGAITLTGSDIGQTHMGALREPL